MEFIQVDYSLNKTYNVEDEAIATIIKKVFSKTKGVRLTGLDIKINDSRNGYEAIIRAKKDKNQSYFDLTKKVEKDINELSTNLINTVPDNLQISFEE